MNGDGLNELLSMIKSMCHHVESQQQSHYANLDVYTKTREELQKHYGKKENIFYIFHLFIFSGIFLKRTSQPAKSLKATLEE